MRDPGLLLESDAELMNAQIAIGSVSTAVVRRIVSRCRQASTGCIEYPLRKGTRYGTTRVKGRQEAVHRLMFAAFHGPIPAGAVVRHSCDNGACVNPAHLLIGRQSDNMKDAEERGRLRRQGSCCVRGHEFTPDNTRIARNGYRYCRACARLACARYQERKRSADASVGAR